MLKVRATVQFTIELDVDTATRLGPATSIGELTRQAANDAQSKVTAMFPDGFVLTPAVLSVSLSATSDDSKTLGQ